MDTESAQHKNYNLINSRFALLTLLIANFLTAVLFIQGDGSIMQVLWIYWLQSVIIGLINVFRIFLVPIKGATADKLGLVLPQGVQITRSMRLLGKSILTFFFMFHYGFFHLVYAIFLIEMSQPNFTFDFNGSTQTLVFNTGISVGAVLLSGLAFAIHHAISFIAEYRYIKLHPDAAPSTDVIIKRPYARIIPMHLIIIFGPMVAVLVGNNSVFILFILFKTVADLELFRRGSGHPSSFSPKNFPSN